MRLLLVESIAYFMALFRLKRGDTEKSIDEFFKRILLARYRQKTAIPINGTNGKPFARSQKPPSLVNT